MTGAARIGSRSSPEVDDPTPAKTQLQDWEQVRGVVTAIEKTSMGLFITVRPEAPDVSFYMRASGTDANPSLGIVKGAVIEALGTPAGVLVRHVDRPPLRS